MLNFIKKAVNEEFSEKEKLKELEKLAKKEIFSKELTEIVKFLKETQAISLNFPDSIDICGTWWSWLPRINTSTISALILSKMWVKILKHWNKASSWRFWSFDLLEELWEKIELSEKEIKENYKEKNLAFLYAKSFFPVMRHFWKVRLDYWKPTIFNILWPLLAPWNPKKQIIWVSDKSKMLLMAKTCQKLWREKVAILRWEDWLDEVTLTWKTKIIEVFENKISEYFISPEDFWLEKIETFDKISWWEKDFNIKIAKEILSWKCKTKHLDLVLINCAFILKFIWEVWAYKEWVKKVREFLKK